MQVALLFIALTLYSATGFMYFEYSGNPDLSWGDTFWWAIVTMTTVGYGDFFPSSPEGRLFVGVPTMVLGVGLLGYLLSLGGSILLESKALEVRGLKDITSEDHVAICGFGSVERLRKLITELHADPATSDSDIVIIDDSLGELPKEVRGEKILFVKGDPGREVILARANLKAARSAIIQARVDDPTSSDDHNLKVALAIECYNPGISTIVECIDPENVAYFKKANCDSVVCTSALSEQMMVQELLDPGVASIVSELTSNTTGEEIYMVETPPGYSDFKAIRRVCNASQHVLLGIRRDNTNHLSPADDFALQPTDRLIIVSANRPVIR